MDPRLVALASVVAAMSVLAFALCVADKARARRRGGSGARRVRERTLLGVALLGGSPGLVLGMLVARHKTRKGRFLAALALVLLAQAAAVSAWLLLRDR